MERNTFFCNLGLYIKSVLVLILLLGGSGSAWADTVIVDGTTIATGWNNGGAPAKSNSQGVSYNGAIFSTTTPGQLTSTSNFTWYSISSSNLITLTSGQTIILEVIGKSSSAKYELSYSSDGKTFNNVKSTIGKTDEFTEYEIDGVAGEYYLYLWTYAINIKSIKIKDPASGATPQPTSFTKSSVTHNSVSLGWTAGGVEENWQIKYNAGSDFNPATEGLMAADDPIEENSYVLSGLNELTTYYAYVRAYINESTQSAWTGPISFTTLEQYPKPVDFTLDSYTGNTATLSWTNGAGTTPTSWQIKYSTTDGFNPDEAGKLKDAIDSNPYTLTDLTEGTTYYARVRAYYGDSHYSSWNTTQISFTPISAWETFDDGIPDTWYNNGFVTNRSGYEGQAFTTNTSNVLRTPRLYAEKDETLSYDVTIGGSGSSYKITAQYSTDRINWKNVESAYTTSGKKTFTAPSTGYYWLRFVNGYYCSVDNLNGFGPADVTHDMKLGTKSIPSTGTAHGDYTASVVVMECGGSGETVTAELYFDGVKVAESEATTVGANRDQTMSLTFTPTETKTANMFIKVIYNGDTELTTDNQSVTISNTTFVLDEKGDLQPTMSSQVLRVNYTAQNGWNTICMPFALTTEQMDQLFGSGWTAYYINSFSDGILNFKKVSSALSTATPYLVYAPNTDEVEDVIYFKSVSIYSGSIGWGSTNITQTKGDASFIGTFAPMAAGSLTGKYGITNEGKLGKGSDKATIKGYRAYIEISGEAPSRLSIAINDDTTTDLGFVRLIDKDAKDIYNLQGQKVKKAVKGIYVVNGRKVIIK